MKRVSATTRLSTGVAALTLSVLLAAQAIGLIPNPAAATLRGRKELCEAVAIRCSIAIQQGDVEGVRAAAADVMARDPEVASAAVRRADGTLLAEVGDHASLWKAPPGDASTPTHVRIPVFDGEQPWGTVEVSFRGGGAGGVWALLANPLFRLCVFVAAAGFVAYHFYLRRSLQYLDPSAVIPERVKNMLDTLAEGVLVLDRQERIVLANRAFAGVVGQPAADLQGVPASRFTWSSPTGDEAARALPWSEVLATGSARTGVALCLRRADSEEARTFTVNCGPILGGEAGPRGALVTFDDVTPIERKNAQLRSTLEMLKASQDEINRQNQELQLLATTDPLTGCLNRRSFFAQFDSHWASSRRYGYGLSVVMVDVDRFKSINDRHGHGVGDQVLQHVAALIKSLAREGDLVCRYGGEEFCVLLTHTDLQGAALAGEKFRRSIGQKPCGEVTVSASIGVSAAELGAQSPQQLIDQADKALYAAKQTGRNRVVRWDRMPGGGAAERQEAGRSAPAAAAQPSIAFGAVTALTSALRYRDAATAAHSQRVADLCTAAARGLLPAEEGFVLEVAALLHDIGKLGVPDAILLKPGPLTEEEWRTMRAHDRLGAEIVAAAFNNEMLTRIVQTHHAWFGGNPRDPGLPTGEQIPAAARLLAIADAYDAMVTDRVYRKGRSRDAAFAELRRCAGRQFDPKLVEWFIDVITTGAARRAARKAADPAQAVARVQEQIDRLAHALDAQDLSLLRAVAGRLVATAGREGLDDVARVAAALETASIAAPDVSELTQKVDELIALCQSVGAPDAGANGAKQSVGAAGA